jgi:Colicin D
VNTAGQRTITFAARQLQRKFKHAADFGVTGPYNRARASRFEEALRAHVEDQTTMALEGTYRSEPVTHFVNPQTGLTVMRAADGAFVSGWRLTPDQLANVLTRGSL